MMARYRRRGLPQEDRLLATLADGHVLVERGGVCRRAISVLMKGAFALSILPPLSWCAAYANSPAPEQPSPPAASVATAPSADIALINGRIITVDASDSVAEAIAVSGSKIIRVGSTSDVRRLVGPQTTVIDLHGLTATPGLIDSHAHTADGGFGVLYQLELSDATSVAEIVSRVSDKVRTLKPGDWLVGQGWDEGKLKELRYVHAADLDVAAPDNPVWLVHTTGHYGVANHNALRLAKVTAATPNPAAGTIDRDAQGEPTGVLKESAMALVERLVPPKTTEQIERGILHMVEQLHQEGMTAYKDPAIDGAVWDAYQNLAATGRLAERVCVLWAGGTTVDSARQVMNRLSTLPKPPHSIGDGRLLSCGVKLFMDGSGGARTAWLNQDWNKNYSDTDTGNRGYPTIEPDVYRQQVRMLQQAGINVGTHAIGDRAIDWVVDTYEDVLRETPTRGLRHTIIHANIPTDHAIERMAALEKQYDAGYPEAQAPFLWWIGDTYAGNFGADRSQRLIPLRSYLTKGVHWGGGSDYPVTPFPARYGLWASVVRQPLRGVYGQHPFGMAQAIDVHTALRSYTAWNARLLFLEDKIGTLERGKEADIAVWDRDPYSVPANALKDLKCQLTVFAGKIVYRASSAQIDVKRP
jgi:predicted amidohydrolase YtcJ